MSKTRTRTLVLGGLLALALMLPACTRSASTPPAEQGTSSSPLDSQQATMEAVRAALLTQTAQAEQAAPAATEVPTQVVAPPEETDEPDTEATAAPTGGVEYVEYTVKPGDWLFMIADNFGVDPQAIVDLNGLASDSQIQPGLVLKIPPSTGQVSTPSAGVTTAADQRRQHPPHPRPDLSRNGAGHPLIFEAATTVQQGGPSGRPVFMEGQDGAHSIGACVSGQGLRCAGRPAAPAGRRDHADRSGGARGRRGTASGGPGRPDLVCAAVPPPRRQAIAGTPGGNLGTGATSGGVCPPGMPGGDRHGPRAAGAAGRLLPGPRLLHRIPGCLSGCGR